MISPNNFSLLGPPGSGKGTQAELLKKELGFAHIETGSALRAVASQDTELGRTVHEIIYQKGEMVPNTIMDEIFRQAIARVPKDQGILFDGAPRYVSQIDVLSNILSEYDRSIYKVIFIDIPEEEAVARISKRYACLTCRHPYILGRDMTESDTICRHCGGQIGQRKDDTVEGVHKRFAVFQSETFPVIEYFEKKGCLIHINGKQSPEEIFRDIVSHINANKSL